jgi:hypothetical protein
MLKFRTGIVSALLVASMSIHARAAEDGACRPIDAVHAKIEGIIQGYADYRSAIVDYSNKYSPYGARGTPSRSDLPPYVANGITIYPNAPFYSVLGSIVLLEQELASLLPIEDRKAVLLRLFASERHQAVYADVMRLMTMFENATRSGAPPYSAADLRRLYRARELSASIKDLMICIIDSLDAN